MFHTTCLLNCLTFWQCAPWRVTDFGVFNEEHFQVWTAWHFFKNLVSKCSYIYIYRYLLKTAWRRHFLWFPALHCWISEMQQCIIFNFLGFLNAMSIFLCFLNSSKNNKNNFNVYFSETVFLNSSSVFCTYIASLFFPMTVNLILFGLGWCVE